MARHTQRGVTLVEAGAATSIAALALSTAIAGFGSLLQARHTEGVAAEVAADLQFARSEAVARNAGVRFSFQGDAGGLRCYVIHTGSAADCSCIEPGPAVCGGGAEAIKSLRFDAGTHTRVQANVASMRFDPTRATVSPTATIEVSAADGRQIRHVVNILGRVRSCAASGNWAGLMPC